MGRNIAALKRGWSYDIANTRLDVYVDGTLIAIFNDAAPYLTVASGLTVTAGGLTVTAGGATITAGGLTVTAGGATITAGGLTLTAGTIKLGDAAHWTANGTVATTISSLGPAGIGVGTISKWLTITDNADVVMYIPAWT